MAPIQGGDVMFPIGSMLCYLQGVNVDRDGTDVAAFDQRPLVVAAEEANVMHPLGGGSHHLGRPVREAFLLRVDLSRQMLN